MTKYMQPSALHTHRALRRLAHLRGETLPAVGTPLGREANASARVIGDDACQRCGFIVCSCAKLWKAATRPVAVDMGGEDATVAHVVNARPAVGTSHPWEVARADMASHEAARWHFDIYENQQLRVSGGQLETRGPGSTLWVRVNETRSHDASRVCYTRLPDEPAQTRTEAIRVRYAGEERVRIAHDPDGVVRAYVDERVATSWDAECDDTVLTTDGLCGLIDRALDASRHEDDEVDACGRCNGPPMGAGCPECIP